MEIDVRYRPAHSLGVFTLQPGETIRAEADAMVAMSEGVSVETQARTKGGGFFKSMKRSFLTGESFFTNTFTARDPGAQVALAPKLCGDMVVHQLDGREALMIQGSSYVASEDSIDLDTKFQGLMKGLLSGESMFFLAARGVGPVLLSAFGGIQEIDLDGELIVDTGHLVAFTEGISYETTKPGNSWLQAFFSGEGIVLRVRGRGKLYLQTRNPGEYGSLVGAMLPAREA